MNATYHGFEKFPLPGPAAGAALVLCALLGVGPQLCLAGPSSQMTFPSPDEAGRALVSAVQEHDERAVTKILGGGHELIGADDQDEERLERERFVQKYQEMHRWARESGGSRTLYIGAENWPFPVPLMSRNGMWRFDSKAGLDEILFRRIGENEVTAIHVCGKLVTAETHPGTDSGGGWPGQGAASPGAGRGRSDPHARLLLSYPAELGRGLCRHRVSGCVPLFGREGFHRHPGRRRVRKGSRSGYGQDRGSDD